jgi:hypothetical protein
MGRSEKEKMLAGELYRPGDPAIQADQAATKGWLVRYNAALALPAGERRALLRERLGAVGEGAVIRPPFHCDYGFNIRLGADAFLNFGCVILDVAAVEIGDGAQIARPCRSTRPTTRATRPRAGRGSSSAAPSGSGPTPGSAAGDPPARSDDRRRCHRRSGRGRDPGRAGRSDGRRQPGPNRNR